MEMFKYTREQEMVLKLQGYVNIHDIPDLHMVDRWLNGIGDIYLRNNINQLIMIQEARILNTSISLHHCDLSIIVNNSLLGFSLHAPYTNESIQHEKDTI